MPSVESVNLNIASALEQMSEVHFTAPLLLKAEIFTPVIFLIAKR